MDTEKTDVEKLIEKAAEAHEALDAMQFAQAACNAANALCAQASAKAIK